MTSFLLDLILLGTLAFFVYQGHKKGLILSAASILIVFISIWGGGLLAERFREPIIELVTPVMSWFTDDATDEAAVGMGRISDIKAEEDVIKIARDAFRNLGVSEKELERLSKEVWSIMSGTQATVRASISQVFLDKIVYTLLYLLGFVMFSILFSLLSQLISTIVRLPGLNLIDKIGGVAAGFVFGVLLIYAVAFVLRFTGILIDQQIIAKSILGNLFVNYNPFSNVILPKF